MPLTRALRLYGTMLMAAVAGLLMVPGIGQAQMKMKTMTQDDIYIIPGIGALVAPEDGKLKVVLVPDDLSEDYTDVDLKSGDFILMVDGKRVKTVEELRKAFASIEIGKTVELGLKRDKAMLIALLKKAAEDDTGGKKMMIMPTTIDSGDGGMQFKGEGPMEVVVVAEIGLVIGSGDGGLSVIGTAQMDQKEVAGDLPPEGARVLSIQGEECDNVKAFEAIYDSIPVGDEVTIEYKADGGNKKLVFARQKMERKMMMSPK